MPEHQRAKPALRRLSGQRAAGLRDDAQRTAPWITPALPASAAKRSGDRNTQAGAEQAPLRRQLAATLRPPSNWRRSPTSHPVDGNMPRNRKPSASVGGSSGTVNACAPGHGQRHRRNEGSSAAYIPVADAVQHLVPRRARTPLRKKNSTIAAVEILRDRHRVSAHQQQARDDDGGEEDRAKRSGNRRASMGRRWRKAAPWQVRASLRGGDFYRHGAKRRLWNAQCILIARCCR